MKIADVTVNKIIKVGDSTGKIPMVVSGVTMSEDKKTASVSLFTNFDNGDTYEISVKGYDETATLVASYGAPKTMTISSKSKMQNGLLVSTYKEETLTYKLFDAQGNDVTNTITGTIIYYAAENSTDYYVNGDIIYIYKNGAEASVTAEFHYYDELANDQVIKTTGVFVGVDKAPDEIVSLSLVPNRYGTVYPNNQISLTYDKDIELTFKLKTTVEGDWEQQYVGGDVITNLGNFGGVNPPTVRMRSTNPDVFDIVKIWRNDKNVDTMNLFKEGTGAVLVDLVNKNPDNTDRIVTIAAAYITVVAKGTVSKIDVFGNVVAGTVNVSDYDIGKIGIAAKDQYGNLHDVNHATAFANVKFADDKAVSAASVTHEKRGNNNGWTDQVVVDGSALLADMVAAGYLTADLDDPYGDWIVNGRKVNQITKTLVITANVWCAPDYPNVDFRVNVTLKKPIAGLSNISVEASGTTSGNIARYSNPNDNSTSDSKAVAFKVFTKSNDVKVSQFDDMHVKPMNNTVVSGAAVGSMWFTLTHDNVDIRNLGYVIDIDADGTVTLDYSTLATIDGNATVPGQYVDYKSWDTYYRCNKNIGSGRYTFTVYRIVKNADNVLSYAYVGATSVSVTSDFGGDYKFVKRLAESVNTVNQESLRECFEFTGRDGQKTENPYYYVDYVVASDYVHVKSVTFYESLRYEADKDEDGVNEVYNNGIYAPYTVNINVSLKKVTN